MAWDALAAIGTMLGAVGVIIFFTGHSATADSGETVRTIYRVDRRL